MSQKIPPDIVRFSNLNVRKHNLYPGFLRVPEPGAQPGTRPETRIFKLSTRKPARNPDFQIVNPQTGPKPGNPGRVDPARKNPALCRALILITLARNAAQADEQLVNISQNNVEHDIKMPKISENISINCGFEIEGKVTFLSDSHW